MQRQNTKTNTKKCAAKYKDNGDNDAFSAPDFVSAHPSFDFSHSKAPSWIRAGSGGAKIVCATLRCRVFVFLQTAHCTCHTTHFTLHTSHCKVQIQVSAAHCPRLEDTICHQQCLWKNPKKEVWGLFSNL